MRTASREEIVEVWDEVCDMDQDQTQALVKQFMDEQPALGMFLFAKTHDLEGGPEEARSIDLALASWQVLTRVAGRRLEEVSSERIEEAEDANMNALEQLEEGSEAEWRNTLQDLMDNYNQRELLGFAVEVLMSGNEEAPELAPDSVGMEMLWLKTVLDCLDQEV